MSDAPVARFTYRAFISYSHRDKAWADWLHKALETYRVPSRLVGTVTAHGAIPRRLNPVFRDREELSSSPELGSRINAALAQSENLIVLCSPAAATSRWVNDEVRAYQRMGRATRIHCLIVAGEPNASDTAGHAADECFCPALRFATDASGQPTTDRAEPVAADARPGRDSKTNAKLKLVAGMLDVGFDALKQREQQRRIRRMTAISVLALLAMAVTSVLAVYALISRHNAVLAQRKAVVAEQAAVVARDDAQRRQGQAEDILGFMLGDLRKKLSTVGRLDLMRAVDDKATAYFATLSARDLTDTTLEQQARLLTDIGQVRLAEGNLTAAVAAFREALDRTGALYARAPANGNRLFDKAQAEYWVGYAAMQSGDDATAEAMFRSYHASAVKLAAMDRHNFAWQKEAGYGLQTLAVMDKKAGRTAEAKRKMQQLFDQWRGWVRQRPGDLQLRFEAANFGSWLGSLALEQGQLGAAEAYFAEQVRDLQQNMAAEPNNADWKSNSVDALGLLSDVQKKRGELGPARVNANSSAEIAAALYAHDADNNEWRVALALCRLAQSELDAHGGATAAAVRDARAAESLLKLAHAKDPKSQRALGSLAHAYNVLARLDLARGAVDGAAQSNAASIGLIEPAWKHNPSASMSLALAQARLLQGELAQRRGQTAEARNAWTATRDLLLADAKPEIAFDRLDPLVRALLLLGHRAAAAPYLKRLTEAGYVPLQPWPGTTAVRDRQTAQAGSP